jgi:hypothetical protein
LIKKINKDGALQIDGARGNGKVITGRDKDAVE